MSFTVESATLTCCHAGCGIVFAVPSWWEKKRREDHTRFFCPNGHGQSFSSESDEEKFRRERDTAKQQLARVEDEKREAFRQRDEARMSAARAVKKSKQLTKRAASGTCPCCTRSFSNMAEHMKKEHPEFVSGTGAKVIPMKRASR